MPCRNAMITDVISCKPDDTVEHVMSIMEENRIRHVPVIDENNVLLGMFGYSHLLNELLPVSVKMEDGLQRINFVIGASPGVAKRLRRRTMANPLTFSNGSEVKFVATPPF